MDYSAKPAPISPRIIIHGGAGNLTRSNLSKASYAAYRSTLLHVLSLANATLEHASALDVATYAVSLLERDPLFNAGHGAVFTSAGTHELEASVMVSTGYKKRGVGVMGVKKAKSPIALARAMLIRGEEQDGGGAHAHNQLHGETADQLAEEWGLELARPSYFWTKKRWSEHRKGLGLEDSEETYEKAKEAADEGWDGKEGAEKYEVGDDDIVRVGDIHWDGKEYLPQGTVGAVVLDRFGVLCAATSTGGLTNKLPGRIGDTPTIGAGFWAEQFHEHINETSVPGTSGLFSILLCMVTDCVPALSGYSRISTPQTSSHKTSVRAVAMSGTGNGDYFLRTNAVRTAAAIARYSPGVSLQQAVKAVAGPNGQLQNSAGGDWGTTGGGEGGIIGIELVDGKGKIAFDFNRGMFHAWIDDGGRARFGIFQEGRRPDE